MADSYRTRRPVQTAEMKIKRTEDGEPVLPRIIVRKPYPGDVHPVSKLMLEAVLRKFGPEYYYGLQAIELVPRDPSKEFGSPFGSYIPAQKTIRLYSLPKEWHLQGLLVGIILMLPREGYLHEFRDKELVVQWTDDLMMAVWFIESVFLHELGHHYVFQYRNKKKKPESSAGHEFRAELIRAKLSDLFDLRPANKEDDIQQVANIGQEENGE